MDLKPLFVFPKWSNTVTLCVLLFLAIFPLYAGALVAYALDPVTLNVGYQPVQPVPYSHALHVGQLGLDCRYCHNTVEKADFAAIPPTETCMNCHRSIRPKSEALAPIRESFATGKPVTKEGETPGWKQVTTVPDYVYFNHSAHVNSGVSCVECHGQINRMEQVYQAKPMNMAWCLQCHRDPESRIRPRDRVTNLDWEPSAEDASTVAAFASLPDTELYSRFAKISGFPVTGRLELSPADSQEMLEVEAKVSQSRTAPPLTTGTAGTQPVSASELEAGRKWLVKKYVSKLIETQSMESVKAELGRILKDQYHINPNTDCITCHR